MIAERIRLHALHHRPHKDRDASQHHGEADPNWFRGRPLFFHPVNVGMTVGDRPVLTPLSALVSALFRPNAQNAAQNNFPERTL